jgi:nitroreductase
MDFEEVIKKRHSVRKYGKYSVTNGQIADMAKLAREAPSAGGLRAYKMFISREKLVSIEAPVYIVVCADPDRSATRYGKRGADLYSIQDATIFAAYLQLIAVDRGFATVWVGAFRESRIKRQLKIASNLKPIVVMPIGVERWN